MPIAGSSCIALGTDLQELPQGPLVVPLGGEGGHDLWTGPTPLVTDIGHHQTDRIEPARQAVTARLVLHPVAQFLHRHLDLDPPMQGALSAQWISFAA